MKIENIAQVTFITMKDGSEYAYDEDGFCRLVGDEFIEMNEDESGELLDELIPAMEAELSEKTDLLISAMKTLVGGVA